MDDEAWRVRLLYLPALVALAVAPSIAAAAPRPSWVEDCLEVARRIEAGGLFLTAEAGDLGFETPSMLRPERSA